MTEIIAGIIFIGLFVAFDYFVLSKYEKWKDKKKKEA